MAITRSRLLFALSLNYAAMVSLAIAVNLLPVFLTTLSGDLGGEAGLTNEQLGRIGGVTFAGLCAAIVITGPLADRMGSRLFAVLGNLLVAVGLAILAFAPGYLGVLIAVFIMGFGAGTLDMILSPIVAALQPDRKAAAMNLLHSFYCIGAVATILVGSLALKVGLGWRAISLWLVVMPLLVAVGFLFLRIPPLVAEGQERTRLRHLIRRSFFLVCLVAIFLGGATEIGMQQWLPTYAENSLGYTRFTAGFALLLFSVAMAVGRIAVGLLGDRLNTLRLLLGCCAGSTLLLILACFSPSPAIAFAACIAGGLTGSCLWPSMLAVAADRFPHGGASMFGLLAAFGNFGGMFMPWMVGLVADHASLRLGLSTATLCPLLMIALLLWMMRQPAPTAAAPVAVAVGADQLIN